MLAQARCREEAEGCPCPQGARHLEEKGNFVTLACSFRPATTNHFQGKFSRAPLSLLCQPSTPALLIVQTNTSVLLVPSRYWAGLEKHLVTGVRGKGWDAAGSTEF